MKNYLKALGLHMLYVFVLCFSAAGLAQGIDAWEPVGSGSALPSATAQSYLTSDVWLGYSDGAVYFASQGSAAVPNWVRMDRYSTYGGIVEMNFGKPITSIAVADSFDEYVAYVAINSDKYYSQLWRVTYGTGGISWTNLSGQNFVDLLSVSVSPLDSHRLYVATKGGVWYSVDGGANWSNSGGGDVLTPPSGCAISALASAKASAADRILVGCRNGEVWSVTGARTNQASWLQLDNGHYTPLPDRTVTQLFVDQRDTSGKTFFAVFPGYAADAIWVTRTGGQNWLAVRRPLVSGGYVMAKILSAAPNPNFLGATLYAQLEGFGAVRSDDSGDAWFATPRFSGKNVAVEYKHYDTDPQSNQIMPLFRIRNKGSVPVVIDNFRIMYLMTPESSTPQNVYCDWSPYGCENIVAASNGSVLDVVVATSGATVAAGAASGEIQLRVAKADWSVFYQDNDLSFIASALNWTLNRNILLYHGSNQWLWGTSMMKL